MTGRPLRFCLVSTFFPPYSFGGDGIAVRRLAIALAEQGHHVEVVHAADAFDTLRPRGMAPAGTYDDHPAIVHHPLRSRAGFVSVLLTQQTARPGLKRKRLRAILDGGNFDVVHFHNASLIGPTAFAYSRATTLYTMHEHWLVCPMHVLWRFNREPCTGKRCIRCQLHGRRPPQLWRYTNVMERSLRQVDALIAPSVFTREMHSQFGLRTDTPVVHIPNFIPLPVPVTGPDPSPHAVPYFLFAGRLERIKGAHVLIEAFKRYAAADLLVAGVGHDAAALRQRAAATPHVRFLGHMPYSALERYMRHAIAVVVPSVGYEVFPTTVLEANALGTPVVGHRLGPLPEMLDGRGGVTYGNELELIAALETLRADPERRAELGARGREVYLAEWTPARHLERYFDLIVSLNRRRATFV